MTYKVCSILTLVLAIIVGLFALLMMFYSVEYGLLFLAIAAIFYWLHRIDERGIKQYYPENIQSNETL